MSTINFGFGCTALTFCFKFCHILGLFCTFFLALLGYFLVFSGCFWSWGQVQKHFWNLLMWSINFGFGSTALTFRFKFGLILGLFCTFFWPFWGYFFGLFGRFLELGSGSKTFLEYTYVVN